MQYCTVRKFGQYLYRPKLRTRKKGLDMDDYTKAIAARVNAYVRNENTTKDALADALEIGRSTFYSRLSGERGWLFDEVVRLSKKFGCTVDELMTMPNC